MIGWPRAIRPKEAPYLLSEVRDLPEFGMLSGAASSLLKILADPYDQLPAITFWLLGSLASIRGAELWSVLPMVLLRWRIKRAVARR